ncbi:MAG: cellulose binding domain-containing protein [Pseudomonadota bacterium]
MSSTAKVSFFYLSVRGDGQLNFAVEDTAEGARFYSPLTGQSLTLRGVSFSELDSSHFEWRANQLEDGIAGRMGLEAVIDGFSYPSENIFTGKSVAMAGLVDRAPYHSQQGYEDYTGTPIGGDSGDGGTGGGDGGDHGGHGDNMGGGDDGTGDTGGTGDGGTGDTFIGDYTLSLDDWGAGFVARFDFTPETEVNGWTAQIATDATIINIWNAEIVSHENGILSIRNASYNANPAPGQSFEVGFQGDGSSAGLELISTTLPLPDADTGDGTGDTTQGGAGEDTLSFAWLEAPTSTVGDSEFGVFVDLSLQGSEQDTGAGVYTFTGFENLEGSDFADVLTGDDAANTVFGLSGSDVLFSGDSDDVLFGGDGYDALEGGQGADALYGGTNSDGGPEGDIATYFSANGPLTFHFGMSMQEFEETTSQEIRDDFIGDDIEGFAGASGFSNTFIADQITGLTFLLGGAEADTFLGGSGVDQLLGLAGDDIMYGGAGNDALIGEGGDDQFYGGAGADFFFLDGTNDGDDTIHDLEFGLDQIFFTSGNVNEGNVTISNTDADGNGVTDALLTYEVNGQAAGSVTIIDHDAATLEAQAIIVFG